jgi:neutral ceramidase
MGYADPNQTGSGVRQRLYSRAFIVGELDRPENRFVYIVIDTQSGDTAIRDGILRAVAELGPDYSIYGQHNIALTGTHSHSGPGAWLNYLLPQITSKGFDKESYQAIVNGTVLSIRRAHESLAAGRLTVGTTKVDANINRSPYAYLANPKTERQKYADDVDKDLTMLRFTRADGTNIGVLTWYAVHGTSMLGNNTLITGDNKGVAAYLFEKTMGKDFVAGFSQANVGDTSPNVLGPMCEDGSNQECRFEDSTCGGRNEPCHGRGPFFGLNDAGTKSCFEIGRRQFEGAKTLYDSLGSSNSTTAVTGPSVRSLHTFVSLANYTFPLPNGTIVKTCPAALGYSFAAGTTDGPGAFDFTQNNSGNANANPLWKVASAFIHEPSVEQKQCQGLKPILLDVGETTKPYPWSPNIVDIQLFRVGQIIIIVSPGEATSMAGRRWRNAIHDAAKTSNIHDQSFIEPIVLLGGPANSYTHYITTEEEYSIQRYEGASTLYGPHTLNAYINLTLSNLPYLSPTSTGNPDPGPMPPINTNKSLSFITGVVVDTPGFFKRFGDIVSDVQKSYAPSSIASAKFIGANPRNDLRLERTFAAVERLVLPTSASEDELKPRAEGWITVLTDADWELIYRWRRVSSILGTSEVSIEWEIPAQVDKGTYRLHYYGDAKTVGGEISPFEGVSGNFEVL